MVLGATQSSSSWVGLIGSRFITDLGGARTYTLPARTAQVNNTTRTAVAQRPSAVAQRPIAPSSAAASRRKDIYARFAQRGLACRQPVLQRRSVRSNLRRAGQMTR